MDPGRRCRCYHTLGSVDVAAQVSGVGDDWNCGIDLFPAVNSEPLSCLSVCGEIIALG